MAMVGVVISGALVARARRRFRWVALVLWLLVSAGALGATAGLFELRKTVGLLVMPLGLSWIGTGVLAVTLGQRGRRRAAVGAWLVFLGLAAAGSVPLGTVAAHVLEQPYVSQHPFRGEPFDVVVVLSGGLSVNPDGHVELGSSGERVMLGAQLFLCGRAQLLVATGPEVCCDKGSLSAAAATCEYWQSVGVPADSTLALTGPRTTGEEIERIAAEARERDWSRIGLVTSAWHLRRAMRLAERTGLRLTPLPADRLGTFSNGGLRLIVPQAEGVMKNQSVCWELLGMLTGN